MAPRLQPSGIVNNIQVLRGIAAVMVVAHHLRDTLVPDLPGLAHIFVGATGVDVFFVISGFVISRSLMDPDLTPWTFMRRRTVRIVPLYWLCLGAIAAMLAVGMRPLGIQDADANTLNMLKSLFFIPFLREGAGVTPLLGVGWTLNLEMFFYLLCAIALALPAQFRFRILACVLITLPCLGWAFQPTNAPAILFTQPLLLEFLSGCALAQWHFSHSNTRSRAFDGYVLVTLGVLGLGLPDLLGWTADFHTLSPQRWLFFGVPAFALVAGAVLLERAETSVSSRNWQLLGAASYALYLTHPLVLQIGERVLQPFGLPVFLNAAVLGIGCIGAGVLVHLWIEKPVTSHIQRRQFAKAQATVA
ncbi:MAG: acyltransferase family protein [Sedimentitalea sp.]